VENTPFSSCSFTGKALMEVNEKFLLGFACPTFPKEACGILRAVVNALVFLAGLAGIAIETWSIFRGFGSVKLCQEYYQDENGCYERASECLWAEESGLSACIGLNAGFYYVTIAGLIAIVLALLAALFISCFCSPCLVFRSRPVSCGVCFATFQRNWYKFAFYFQYGLLQLLEGALALAAAVQLEHREKVESRCSDFDFTQCTQTNLKYFCQWQASSCDPQINLEGLFVISFRALGMVFVGLATGYVMFVMYGTRIIWHVITKTGSEINKIFFGPKGCSDMETVRIWNRMACSSCSRLYIGACLCCLHEKSEHSMIMAEAVSFAYETTIGCALQAILFAFSVAITYRLGNNSGDPLIEVIYCLTASAIGLLFAISEYYNTPNRNALFCEGFKRVCCCTCGNKTSHQDPQTVKFSEVINKQPSLA
jgi:hypothetical protein